MNLPSTALRVLVLGAVGLVGLSTAIPASAEDQNVSAVWSLEDDYWRFVKAGDVENYRTLWHKDFVGWPCHKDHPAGKSAIGDWVQEIRDKRVTFTADLTREAAQDFGNIVVVHYRSTMVSTYPDGRVEGRGQVSKFTHTWMRVGSSWQIIGGMCGRLMEPGK
ncbi:MAG: nuclear transport factor 2 family protein [Actinomycetota bacterium]|nr:nuclear transport factor 2 family protein [Actinomycetota bacterium]